MEVISGVINWGFNSGDVFRTGMLIVGSVSGFILLGLAVRFAPTLALLVFQALTSPTSFSWEGFKEEFVATENYRRSGGKLKFIRVK